MIKELYHVGRMNKKRQVSNTFGFESQLEQDYTLAISHFMKKMNVKSSSNGQILMMLICTIQRS